MYIDQLTLWGSFDTLKMSTAMVNIDDFLVSYTDILICIHAKLTFTAARVGREELIALFAHAKSDRRVYTIKVYSFNEFILPWYLLH